MVLRVWKRFWRFCCPRKIYRAESALSLDGIRERLDRANLKILPGLGWANKLFNQFRIQTGFVEEKYFQVFLSPWGPFSILIPGFTPVISGEYVSGNGRTQINYEIATHPFARLWFGFAILWTLAVIVFVAPLVFDPSEFEKTTPIPLGKMTMDVPIPIAFPLIGILFCLSGYLFMNVGWWFKRKMVEKKFGQLLQTTNVVEIPEKL